jgi:hypothetical protein
MSMKYIVKQSDCIDSIAHRFGFFPDTLWKHPANSELKKLRKDPNVLQPGDTVEIPDLQLGEESCVTEEKHTFKRKGVPAKLRLVFYRPVPPEEQQDEGGEGSSGGGPAQEDDESIYEETEEESAEEPVELISNAPYIIDIDGELKAAEGQSDGDGMVEIPIPPNAQNATIRFYPGTEDEISFPLNLGEMDSIETVIGVRKRLFNMGYRCHPEGDEMDPDLKDALMRFQQDNDLQASGETDQATKDKLVEVHGS